MSTLAESPAPATPNDTRSWLERWSPIGGLFFVAFIVILIITGSNDDETPADVVKSAKDDETLLIVLQLLALASVALLGWFVAGLAARVSRVAGTMETIVVAISGAAFTFLSVIALTVWIAPLLDIEDDPARALAQAEAYLMMDDFGWVLLGAGGVGAGVMIAMCSYVALRSGNVPGWLGWLGVIAGVVSLASVAFFGMFGWLVWFLVASIGMLVRRA